MIDTMTDETQWRAVTRRDPARDGHFVFAVRTTRIYCRPSCPARRPHRHNVTFYPVPEAAEADGYRACKRCRPERVAMIDPGIELVRAVVRALSDHAAGEALAAAARERGQSVAHARRVFKRIMGVTPRAYHRTLQYDRLRRDLRSGNGVTPAQFSAGFSSSSRVYESADRFLGMTPGRYRRGGAGVAIQFGFGRTSLGQVLVAVTDRGVCAVRLGDRREDLERDLRAEFPQANVRREDAAVDTALTRILEGIEGGRPSIDVPLDLQATAFQARVWTALSQIPRGETRTYTEIARAIGAPRSVRAVASACAANPVAVVIPCHRVVRRDGRLGGYRWGVDRKQALLDRERDGLAGLAG